MTIREKRYGFAVLGLIALVGLVLFLGRPKPIALTVTGYYWQRTITVEQLRPTIEEGWEGWVQGGVHVLGVRRELYQTDSRGRQVYKNRIRYATHRWFPDHEVRAQGTDHVAVWPFIPPSSTERKGRRTELYQVFFRTAEGRSVVYQAPDEQSWQSFEEGRTYRGKIDKDERVVAVAVETPGDRVGHP